MGFCAGDLNRALLNIVILGEFIGSQEGVGYFMNRAKIYFKTDDVFFYLSVILGIMVCFQIVQQFLFSLPGEVCLFGLIVETMEVG